MVQHSTEVRVGRNRLDVLLDVVLGQRRVVRVLCDQHVLRFLAEKGEKIFLLEQTEKIHQSLRKL